jgi:hypothetical protein
MSNQVQNKPTAAYWLSLIGGIIGILASLAFIVTGLGAMAVFSEYSDYYGYSDVFTGFGVVYLAIGIWCIVTSALVITFARRLNARPLEHTKYGIMIIIFSIIGLGTLFGLVGGILALIYKPNSGMAPQYAPQQQYYAPPPQQAAYQQAPPQPQIHYCQQCGSQVQAGVRFCPNCGKQQF